MILRLAILALGGLMTLSTASAASLGVVVSQALTPLQTCVLSAYPSGATVEANVWVGSGAGHGVKPLYIRSYKTNQDRRIYISFDLTACSPTIPATATVRQAVLRLFATALPPGCRTEDVFSVGDGYAGSTAWTEPGLNNGGGWNNQPFGTTLNYPPSSAATASAQLGSPATCANHTANSYLSWDVTSDVAGFVSAPTTNYGWMIRDDAENSATQEQAAFDARATGSAPGAPQLTVSYTLGP